MSWTSSQGSDGIRCIISCRSLVERGISEVFYIFGLEIPDELFLTSDEEIQPYSDKSCSLKDTDRRCELYLETTWLHGCVTLEYCFTTDT